MRTPFLFPSSFKWLRVLSCVALACALGMTDTCKAVTGLFFNVVTMGTAAQWNMLNINLALDGLGPISTQDYRINGLNLIIKTTIPHHEYRTAGIKIQQTGYRVAGLPRAQNGYYIFSVSDLSPANLTIIPPNPPWYPSLEAFEHYNSGRSHVFPEATFGGSYTGNNVVNTFSSPWYILRVIIWLSQPRTCIHLWWRIWRRGGFDRCVCRQVDPKTLVPLWYNQLINTDQWRMGLPRFHRDFAGWLYLCELWLSPGKTRSAGRVVQRSVSQRDAHPENTSYNGFNATSDGTIVMKSVYRQAGCTIQGPDALLNCP